MTAAAETAMAETAGPDPAEMRRVLREAGENPPERGQLGAAWRQRYDQLAGDRYDPGTSAAAAADEPPGPAGAGPGEQRAAERPPRDIKTAKAAGGGRLRGLLGGKTGAKSKRRKPARKTYAWVQTSPVIEHFWSQLAWAARPLPPMQKVLAAQAPMAGVVLQDAARDTVIDRAVLQPAARLEDRLEAANAMLGPPVFVGLITAFGGVEMVQTDQGPRPLLDARGGPVWDARTRPLVGGLRFSLMSWLRISGRHAEQIKEAAGELTRLGDEADDLIRWIFAPPVPGADPGDVEAEARQRGAEFMAAAQDEDQAAGAASPGPEGEDGTGWSAFTPAPALGGYAGPTA